jgi:hypothetical protein
MPSVLILKRKAIRVYPDNQKVALYYSQALDKYVTIPYNDIQFGLNEATKKDDDDKDNVRINKALKRNPKYKKVSSILKTGKVPPETDTTERNKRFKDVSSRVGVMGAIGVELNKKIKDRFRAKAVEKAVTARNAARAAKKTTLEENPIGAALRAAGPWIAKKTGQAFSKGTKATKGSGKGAGKGKASKGRMGLAGTIGAGIGAAAGGGGGSGSGSNASNTSSAVNHKFSLKPSTSSSVKDTSIKSTRDERERQANLKMALRTESNVLNTIKSIVENDISEQTIRFNKNEITINNTVAKKLLNVYESVNKTNKKKMEQMLNESATSFNKILTFAVRQ